MVIGFGSANSGLVSPQAKFEAGSDKKEPPQCHPLSPQELYAETKEEKGKVAGFTLEGRYRCPKDIFAYGERDSFYDFVVSTTPTTVGPLLSHIKSDPALRGAVWSVRIQTAEMHSDVRLYLEGYFEALLAEELGPERVARLGSGSDSTERLHILQIELRQTIIPHDLLHYAIKTKHPETIQERVLWES